MFLRILFKKLGIKENKWHLALVYGLFYMIFFFILIIVFELYLHKQNLLRNIIFSIVVGIGMFALYLLKWKLFYSKAKI